ncbi:hypothetical protein EDB19DRAFT_907706 [Suillus lakei]|nr:hypothetical protein EDB19DRAFT_907706 [Suillus lakei]
MFRLLVVALTSLWVSYISYHDLAMTVYFHITFRYTITYFACLTRQVEICLNTHNTLNCGWCRSLLFLSLDTGSAQYFISPAVTFHVPSCC